MDAIRSPFKFEGVVRKAIHQLKYQNLRGLAPLLAKLLQDYLTGSPVSGEVLVPVPLHPKRLRERGYNQSTLLAKELGRLINMPVIDDSLVRNRNTPSQTKTENMRQRRDNVAGAFACRAQRLQGKKVVLIDDVTTSGATLEACARALKRAGSASVWGLTLAMEV